MNRFDFVEYDLKSAELSDKYKLLFSLMEENLNEDLIEKGRSFAATITKLEEAFMWVGKAIRDDQLKRNISAEVKKI